MSKTKGQKMSDTSNQEMTLDQLAATVDDAEGFAMDRGGGFTKKLKLETTYFVKFLSQAVTVSEKNGYYVAKFELGVINGDGSIGTGDKIVQCLPFFSDDVLSKGDPEKLSDLKKNWGTGLHSILRAVNPTEWAVYDRYDKASKKFYDTDGNVMSNAEKKAREMYISKGVIGVAMAMVHEKYSLVDKTCYFVWAPNKKDAANPYANFWSVAPDKYPLFE